ncbi:hypothetical protein CP02DC14_1291, partial [Chlamydia psittaci 02DC14]
IRVDPVSSGQNRFEPVKIGLSRSGLVSASLVWFEPVKTSSGRSKQF